MSFLGRDVSILCQNENGPCPLLAICNVLLLRNSLRIHPDYSQISPQELIQLVANKIIESNPPAKNETMRMNQQQVINDVITILPKLLVGLDVNVRFTRYR